MKKKHEFGYYKSNVWRKTLKVMKLTTILILFAVFSVTAKGFGQGSSISLKMENVSLKDVFMELTAISDYTFVYSENAIAGINVDVLELEEATFQKALDVSLEETGLAYYLENNVVVIRKMDLVIVPKKGQEKKKLLKGIVRDEDGNTLPGVSVVVKGTTIGAATNIDGNYSIQFKTNNAILIFSFVGMVSKEIAYNGQPEINVTLKADAAQMAEVVVTGYQTISKERATGSFEKVSVSQIEKPSSSISERLVGMMAGVNTTVSAEGEVDFEIRGQSSLNADAQPLIVVDGFPIAAEKIVVGGGDKVVNINPFNSINPNDVESVTVLKDAAAASIWGAKSANGVIVITTKKAKKGKAKVDFSSFVKISPKLDLNYVNPRASSAQTIDYERKGFESDLFGGATYWRLPNQSIMDVTKKRSLAFIAMNEYRLGRISESKMNSTLGRLSVLNNQKQIKDNLLQNPVTQQYNLSVSGGSEKMSNYLSLMYENNKNNFKENSIDRFMINYRSRVQLAKWLNFNFGSMIQSVHKTENGISLSEIKNLQPYDMLIDDKGNLNDLNYLYYYKPVMDEMIPKDDFSYSDWSYNPISEIKRRGLKSSELNIRLQGELKADIMEGLSYNTKIMYEHFTSKGERIYDEDSFNMRRMVNETSTWNRTTGEITPNMPKGAAFQQESTTIRNSNFRNQLNFHKVINEKHTISLVAGTEVSSKVLEKQNYADLIGYNKDRLTSGRLLNEYSSATKMWLGNPINNAHYYYNISLDPTNTLRYAPSYGNYNPAKFRYTTDRYFSLYGNLSYTLNDKYTLTGSVRTDASNLITDDPKYRYAPFWSTGFGWQLGKEEFLKDILWLDRLNVRATFGYNGNVDKSTSFRPLISIGSVADIYTNDITAYISNYGNPTLRWEKTQSFDLGFDFSMFSSKLHGSVDYYYKKGIDLIVQQTMAAINGTTSQKFNNGEMVNKGMELKLGSSIPIRGKNIKWSGNLNFAYNKNKITKFYKTSYRQGNLYNGGTSAYSEGMDANTMWAYEYAGVKNLGTENDPKYGPTIKGVNGETYNLTSWSPGSDARKYMKAQGTTVAPYIIGFQNMFKLYDFDLSFTITGKFGHVYRRHAFNYPSMSGGNTYVNNKYSEVANGDPSKIVPLPTNEPRYYFGECFRPYMSYLTADASHIRFQEVSLTYNFPKNMVSKFGFNNARIFAQANNLGTIVFNDFNEDPEYPVGTLKPQTAFTFGVKLNL